MNRVKGKIALVTGAAQGIGLAIAELLANEGAIVILTDIQEALSAELTDRIVGSHYVHLDVSSEENWMQVQEIIVKKFGKLDILINNAAITGFQANWGPQDPEHASLESWRKVHVVNQDGVFLGCKVGIALMKEQGGSIVNISSRSGKVGTPGAAAYASSKASVCNHSKSVALYCAEKSYAIRCNSVHPAAVLTQMWEPFLEAGETREKAINDIKSNVPLKRLAEPSDVAYAVLYLVSDEGKYITGTELNLEPTFPKSV